MRLARMPVGFRNSELIGVSIVSGIGFTMSLFITVIGFENQSELIEPAKIGILLSSIFSVAAGSL